MGRRLVINPANVLRLVEMKLRRTLLREDGIGVEDESFACFLVSIIVQKYEHKLETDTVVTLTHNYDASDDNDEQLIASGSDTASAGRGDGSSESEFQPSPDKKVKVASIITAFDDNTLENIYDDYHVRGFNTYDKLLKRYPKLKAKSNIKNILDYVAKKREGNTVFKGNRTLQFKIIKERVMAKFDEARECGSAVHYWHLQHWALDVARNLGCTNFTASLGFITNLKKEFRITSRRITMLQARKDKDDEEELIQRAQTFVADVNEHITTEKIEISSVWNCDQSQFNYELSSDRTLSMKGERNTVSMLQSVNSATHSYTIDVAISMEGRLADKLYICFQEPSGKFGPRVSREIETRCPPNVFVDASVSGKMTKQHLKTFFLSVLNPNLSRKSLVLCDSWSGHKDEQVLLEASGGKDVDLKIIPPKTTKYAQPLDVYFFRQYKIYAKRITDFIKLRSSNMQPKLHDRCFIMNLHSVIYNQLSAGVYRPMLRYAWQNAGYDIGEPVDNFKSVIDVAFNTDIIECANMTCDQLAFLHCAFCSHSYCCEHFIASPHLHL